MTETNPPQNWKQLCEEFLRKLEEQANEPQPPPVVVYVVSKPMLEYIHAMHLKKIAERN